MKTPQKRILPFIILAGLGLGCASLAHADIWYWQGSNSSDNLISKTTLWNSAQGGTGTTSSFISSDTYDANGGTRILLDVGTNKSFAGGLLIMNASSMSLKASTPGAGISKYTINQAEVALTGATVALNGGSGNEGKVVLSNLNLIGQLTLSNGRSAADWAFDANVGNVTGSGSFYLKGAASACNINFSVTDTSLTNAFTVDNVNVTLVTGITTTESLLLKTGAHIDLNNQSVVFSAITDGTNSLADGTYTAGDLASTPFAGYFAGAGSITVSAIPEPSACALLFGGLTLGCVGIRRKRPADR